MNPELEAYYAGGPRTWQEAFPPVCFTSHWDPTQVSQYVLPAVKAVPQPVDPRPSTRICTSYYNTSPGDATAPIQDATPLTAPFAFLGSAVHRAPAPNTTPFGGRPVYGFPNAGYAAAIQAESDLYRLTEPLTRCAERRYIPAKLPATQSNEVPGASANAAATQSLSPYAFVADKTTGCRAADDAEAWKRSNRLFFNPTKYDRVAEVRGVEGRNVLSYPY
jgi:hypothetical protein